MVAVSAKLAPAKDAIPAIRSAWSHAIRWDMYPPFEWPSTKTRRLSTGYRACTLAIDETVILLHPLLLLVGVSIVMERERQQNDSIVNGYCTSSISRRRYPASSAAACPKSQQPGDPSQNRGAPWPLTRLSFCCAPPLPSAGISL